MVVLAEGLEVITLLQPILDVLVRLLAALILAVTPIAVAFVVQWLQNIKNLAFAKLSKEQQVLIDASITAVVKAAEQMGVTGQLEELGLEKKEWAIEQLQNIFSRYGLTLTAEEIAARLEAAINAGLQKPQTPLVDLENPVILPAATSPSSSTVTVSTQGTSTTTISDTPVVPTDILDAAGASFDSLLK